MNQRRVISTHLESVGPTTENRITTYCSVRRTSKQKQNYSRCVGREVEEAALKTEALRKEKQELKQTVDRQKLKRPVEAKTGGLDVN